MERHALAFRVRPGTEADVASLLSGYDPPRLDIADGTRLLATAVFMQSTLVVRNIEIDGDLGLVSRHIAADPNVRRIETQLAPLLEDPYDPQDPVARQGFFRTRLMRREGHVEGAIEQVPGARLRRFALRHPVRPGAARAAALALLAAGPLPSRADGTVVHGTTLFTQGDDLLVQVLTVDGDIADVVDALSTSPAAAAVSAHLDPAPGPDGADRPAGLQSFRTSVLTTLLERERLAAGSL